MTVAELIAKLQTYPPDMVVTHPVDVRYRGDTHTEAHEIDEVEIHEPMGAYSSVMLS